MFLATISETFISIKSHAGIFFHFDGIGYFGCRRSRGHGA
jgi:hypothetical protein